MHGVVRCISCSVGKEVGYCIVFHIGDSLGCFDVEFECGASRIAVTVCCISEYEPEESTVLRVFYLHDKATEYSKTFCDISSIPFVFFRERELIYVGVCSLVFNSSEYLCNVGKGCDTF